MKLSKESRRLARDLFRASLTDGQPDPARVRVVLERLEAVRPRGVVGILKEYHRMIRTALASRRAVVDSAAPLDPADTARLAGLIHSRFGSGIEAEFRVDPSLIGGLRVQIGSDVWDGSVRDRLDRLKLAF